MGLLEWCLLACWSDQNVAGESLGWDVLAHHLSLLFSGQCTCLCMHFGWIPVPEPALGILWAFSVLGCLSWGSNTPGSILLWPEQDILKNSWFSWSTIFKFQILNQFVTFVFICLENSFDTFSIYQHWIKTFQNVWLVLSLCVTLSFRAWG